MHCFLSNKADKQIELLPSKKSAGSNNKMIGNIITNKQYKSRIELLFNANTFIKEIALLICPKLQII